MPADKIATTSSAHENRLTDVRLIHVVEQMYLNEKVHADIWRRVGRTSGYIRAEEEQKLIMQLVTELASIGLPKKKFFLSFYIFSNKDVTEQFIQDPKQHTVLGIGKLQEQLEGKSRAERGGSAHNSINQQSIKMVNAALMKIMLRQPTARNPQPTVSSHKKCVPPMKVAS